MEEKLIRILFNKFNQIISRDEIAQGLWGSRWLDKYSEWIFNQEKISIGKFLSSIFIFGV